MGLAYDRYLAHAYYGSKLEDTDVQYLLRAPYETEFEKYWFNREKVEKMDSHCLASGFFTYILVFYFLVSKWNHIRLKNTLICILPRSDLQHNRNLFYWYTMWAPIICPSPNPQP